MVSTENQLGINHIKQLFSDGNEDDSLQRKLLDFLPIIVYISDPENKKVNYINKRITELLGYSFDDINEWEDGFMHVVFKDDIEATQRGLAKIMAIEDDNSHSYNTRLVNKKGDFRYFKTFGVPFKRNEEGKTSSVLFFLEDITEKTISENELKQARILLGETETMLHYGLYTLDIAANKSTWSDGLYELFEFENDLRPTDITLDFYLDHIADEDREWFKEAFEDSIKKKRNYELEYRIVTAKGSKKIVNSIGKIVLDEAGNVEKVIGSIHDITKIRLYENELKKNVTELNKSNKELEEFAYVASHDMQEPLRKITTFSERLQNKYKALLPDEASTYLDRISGAAHNMRILIDNLLEFSRIGTAQWETENVDLNTTVAQVLKDLDLKIEETKVDISIGQLPTLLAVQSQMVQLFNNLIANAIKFRKQDLPLQIDITSQIASKEELEKVYLPHGRLYHKITITDNGIGFSEEYKDRIFQLFQRLHGKSEYPGSGIGLSICKKIVEQHHGIIFGEGSVNKGAKFTILLPEQP
jgi:PAS domain S-box-containing protein